MFATAEGTASTINQIFTYIGSQFPIENPILTFTFLMLMILLAPMIANRLRVPDLILLLGCGALLGPNGLRMIERGDAITMLGSIGLLYIMFIAGLEIDLNRFAKTKGRTTAFGLLTFSLPQFTGTLMGHYLLGFDWITSILLGSMFASHTLLAYPIASRLGISRSEPVVVAVGGTIITDTLALLVLAVIAESARGSDLGIQFWVTLLLGMTAFIALIVWGVPRLTTWFFSKATESGGAQFLFVLSVVCGCAYLSHFAKMEPIIGAFLVGAAFNRLIPKQSALMNRLSFVGNTLFIPFFLISVGMLVDLRALRSPSGWLIILSISACILLTKYTAAIITGKLFGYDKFESKVIFGLSVIQAAATLATVMVGYNLGLFDEHVLNGAIVSILVSCPLGAWVVDRYGRKMAGRARAIPEPPVAGQRLLVSVVHPKFSLNLLNFAFLLRDKSRTGGIYPVTIANDLDNTDDAVAKSEKLLAQCLTESASAEMKITPSIRVDLNPADGLIRAAQELRATLVLAGWSQRSLLESRLFGTVPEKLMDACPSRLMLCHLPRPLNITKRILMPLPALAERRTDLTELIRDAKHLSRQVGATLRIYLVANGGGLTEKIKSAKPTECSLAIIEGKSWTEVQALFLKEISGDDMVLLPGERRSGTFWTPVLEKLLRIVFDRFPEINLLCSCPPLPRHNQNDVPGALRSSTKPEIFSINIPSETSGEAGLHTMLQRAFGDNESRIELVMPKLLRAANTLPLELTEDIAFIHAHSDKVFRPMIIIGKAATQWNFENLPGTYRILFVLLSPEHAPPEEHLKILSDLARNFLNPEFAEQARNATKAEIIEALLLQQHAED